MTEGARERWPWRALALLWLCGAALRLTILAVPAVITQMQAELALSGTEVGILSALPVVLFGLFAVPGSVMVARLGLAAALIIGLLVAAIGGALRGTVPSVAFLYLMTLVMAAGVATLQVALPAAVRLWTPQRMGFATAVYTNGLLFGEILPVALTGPVVMPLVGGSWEASFAVWSAPLLLIAIGVYAAAPREEIAAAGTARWWPDWRRPLLWRLALLFSSITATYFAANTFLPPYLAEQGRSDLIVLALTALNVGQLPASFLLLAFADRIERETWPYLAFGLIAAVALLGIVLTAGMWTVVWAALLGFCCAGALTLGLTLPALMSRPEDVARLAGGMFTISYAGSVLVSIVSGAAWDLSGSAAFAFLPIGLGLLPLLLCSPGIPFKRAEQ